MTDAQENNSASAPSSEEMIHFWERCAQLQYQFLSLPETERVMEVEESLTESLLVRPSLLLKVFRFWQVIPPAQRVAFAFFLEANFTENELSCFLREQQVASSQRGR